MAKLRKGTNAKSRIGLTVFQWLLFLMELYFLVSSFDAITVLATVLVFTLAALGTVDLLVWHRDLWFEDE